MSEHIVYIIECNDCSYYTGYTTDLERRIKQHNNGDASKYTRGRTPVELVYSEKYRSKSNALSREYEIKQLTHKQKQNLINNK